MTRKEKAAFVSLDLSELYPHTHIPIALALCHQSPAPGLS